MNASLRTARTVLALGLVAATPLVTGCGLLIDGAYLFSNKRYTETVMDSRPTGQVNTTIEYDAAPGPDGQARLTCASRERRIERIASVEKTFERRGSFDAGTYLGAATVSGLVTVITGVVIGAVCLQDPTPGKPRPSCLNMLYVTPFAADIVYSIIRSRTVKPPKLVEKQTTEPTLDFAGTPSRSEPVACDNVEQVMLGLLVGPSDVDVLNGRIGGQKPHLVDGSLPVALGEGGVISLAEQPEVVHLWAKNESLGLWVVDREGAPHRLTADRCTLLRRVSTMLVGDEQVAFQRSCPPPALQQPR